MSAIKKMNLEDSIDTILDSVIDKDVDIIGGYSRAKVAERVANLIIDPRYGGFQNVNIVIQATKPTVSEQGESQHFYLESTAESVAGICYTSDQPVSKTLLRDAFTNPLQIGTDVMLAVSDNHNTATTTLNNNEVINIVEVQSKLQSNLTIATKLTDMLNTIKGKNRG